LRPRLADPRRELGHKTAYIVIIGLAACDLATFWMLALRHVMSLTVSSVSTL